ncbi:MAG: hypothetical protein ACYSUI_21855 [Planctomycetota bacterium]
MEKGLKEVSFLFSLEHVQGSGTYLAIMGEYGYMITQRHELGPVLNMSYSDPSGGRRGSSAAGGAGLFYRYNIPNKSKRLLPFVGGRALGFFGGIDSMNWELRPEIGIRMMPAPGASVNLILFYREIFQSDPAWGDRWGSRFGVTAGVSIFF